MKTTTILFLFLFAIISCDNQLLFKSEIIHQNAELGKVTRTSNGDNLIISKVTGKASTLVSRLDKGGNFIYHNSQLNLGYSGNGQVTESKVENGKTGFTFYHTANSKDTLRQFTDENGEINLSSTIKKDYATFSGQTSLLTLANGKIFFAGIINPSGDHAETRININIYDPTSNANSDVGQGVSVKAYSKYFSCYEQSSNNVYCLYVYEENLLKSLLGIQYFKVTETGLALEGTPYLIKALHTELNYIKAVKFSENEVIIAFETGNPSRDDEISFGNTGKDLFYYHLFVHEDSFKVERYDYIYNECRYRKDPLDYHLDIMPLTDTLSMVICEVENDGKSYSKTLKGYKITKGTKKIEYIDFTKFDSGKGIKNPQLVKFDKVVGILYTQIYKNDSTSVNLINMNYPTCEDATEDIKFYGICPNGGAKSDITNLINLKMVNPYPSSMANTQLYYRFVNTNGMVLKNGEKSVELNKDYKIGDLANIIISSNDRVGNSFIAYSAVGDDTINEGVIVGKTCNIVVNYPKCLEQCYGCDEEGTNKYNHCFDCRDGYYPVASLTDDTGCGVNKKLYNCPKCDVACTLCTGPLDYSKPSTNCKPSKCNFAADYFPYENDLTVCFNATEKTKWEKLLKSNVLFLDKSAGDNKELWVWRNCHERCGECLAKGDDTDNKCTKCRQDDVYNFFFYCNQTKDNGIPGNCHESCEHQGCYKHKADDGHTKMCPCLEQCKTCTGPTTCQECWPTWLLQPEKTSCKNSCEYCFTPYYEDEETKTNGRCVNCKDDFTPPRYTWNNRCYTSENMPYFNYTEYGDGDLISYLVNKKYHVIDPKCNMLTGCKRGCHKCSVLESDLCTECEVDYYKEDPFGKTADQLKTFKCFSKETCQGLVQYPHDRDEKVGGVPLIEDGTKVCLNCRQRNDSYRQPEPKFYCGTFINRTYIDIPSYNKLSECYLRCKNCTTGGVPYAMNCISCRDGKYYEPVFYGKNENGDRIGNCYRKQHKCGVYPYYHNYEIAEDEDNCGEDCDVCLYDFQCPPEFPYFKYETHECVEFCPVTDVLGGLCNVTSNAAVIILMKNPFGLRNPYDFCNQTVYVDQILSSSLFQYICASYNCDANTLSKNINNYVGHGNVYNLPEPKVIIGNNMTIELSTAKFELEKLAKYLKGELSDEDETPITSALDLSECEKILKKKYGLPEEEELIVIKADILQQFNLTDYLPTTEYQLFSTSIGAFLPLNLCKDEGTDVTVTNPITSSSYDLLSWLTKTQSKTAAVIVNGYDVFNAESPFYNDICTPFTNENGNDVLLDARRNDYYSEGSSVNLCNNDCIFVGYNTASKTYTCKCNINNPGESSGEYQGENIVEKAMPENFKDLISRRSNIAVFKCASQVFSSKGQSKNVGSYILLIALASMIGVVVYYFLKEKKDFEKDNLGKSSLNTLVANPPNNDKGKKEKNEKKREKSKEKDKGKKEKKPEKHVVIEQKVADTSTQITKSKNLAVKKDDVYSDYLLNYAPFKYSCNNDKRSFLQIYWSYLKFKQFIIFTFYTPIEGILRSARIVLFILFVAFYMAFTALFFNDNIMRSLYIYKGNTDAAVHVPNIILSSLCSLIASLIVRFICLDENKISKIAVKSDINEKKNLMREVKKCHKIKFSIMLVISFILTLICWYYVAAFCAVFKNSQKSYLVNTLVSFIICNLWPAVTSLIPTYMRKKALDKKNETLYKASQYIAYL